MAEPELIVLEQSEEGLTQLGHRFLGIGNLADKVKDPHLPSAINALYNDALSSMKEWKEKYAEALKLAKMQPEAKHKTFPFENASVVMMPYILEAMLDFSARASPELVWATKIVSAKIYGSDPDSVKKDRAKRVGDYMNYQVSDLIQNWRENQDKLVMALPCVGTAYKEIYYDSNTDEIVSELCQADEIIFNHNYKSFNIAPDKFKEAKFTKNEVVEFIRGPHQWLMEISDLDEEKNEFNFLVCHTWIDLDEDDYDEPYMVVICQDHDEIVYIEPMYDEDTITTNDEGEIVKIEAIERFIQYIFLSDPEGGPMGLGWGILLGDMFRSINTTARQLLDSGTLHNTASNSGFIDAGLAGGVGGGMSVKSGPVRTKIGQLTQIQSRSVGKSLRDSIVQFPFSGPSQTLFTFMDYLIEASRKMTNASVNVEANAGEAASLYLARLKQGLKVVNSITMRVYNAAQKEFAKIAQLNFEHYDDDKYNAVLDGKTQASMQEDFNPEDMDIRIVADPSQGSEAERMAKAEIILAEAKQQPSQIINLREAYLLFFEAIGVENIEAIAPEPTGEPSQQEQMMAAQMAHEAELKERELSLREDRLALDEAKAAASAMKDAKDFGLAQDTSEAKIVEIYANAVSKLAKAALDSGNNASQAIQTIQTIEDRFIGDATNDSREAPTEEDNPKPARDLAE